MSLLSSTHICTKVWGESPSEDGWSLACVAALSLCLVSITSATRWTLLMFLLRYNEGKGTDEPLLMLTLARSCNYWAPLHFASAGSSSKHRDNDDSSALAGLLSPSLSKPKCKPAKLISYFFCILCVELWNFCAIVQSFSVHTTIFWGVHLLSVALDKQHM